MRFLGRGGGNSLHFMAILNFCKPQKCRWRFYGYWRGLSEDLKVLCFSPVLIIELSEVQPPMESTPLPPPPNPPHEKLLTPASVISMKTLLTRNSQSLQQGVIHPGPVGDGLWPERNKVFLILSVIREPSERSVRGSKKKKSSLAESCVQACVHCRCLEKCSCVRPVVQRFLNTGKHEHSILRNPLELFTHQQHTTVSESALITLPDTLGCDVLGNKETTISNSPDAPLALLFCFWPEERLCVFAPCMWGICPNRLIFLCWGTKSK